MGTNDVADLPGGSGSAQLASRRDLTPTKTPV
jgi:hypothetical protein